MTGAHFPFSTPAFEMNTVEHKAMGPSRGIELAAASAPGSPNGNPIAAVALTRKCKELL
jgi:hypothetical protein